jgi:hypothetical protein
VKVTERSVENSLDWLRDNAEEAAKARATRLYMEEWLPALKAKLAAAYMENGDSATAAELKARAHKDYADALISYRVAVEDDERARWKRTMAEAVLEVWRSLEATRRAQEKVQ